MENNKIIPPEKTNLHPRNKHRLGYNFSELVKSYPNLATFVKHNIYGNESIEFSNSEAVLALNKSLLVHFYNTEFWDIPTNYLCPPIPSRADYIHYIADLLATSNNNSMPIGVQISVLDIGVGANCIYPIIGRKEYGWKFIASDIDQQALDYAGNIVRKNSLLNGFVELRLQTTALQVFKGVVRPSDKFDVSICNPPFHASLAEAKAMNELKWKKLGLKNGLKSNFNFGGKANELCYKGGEAAFLHTMIDESVLFKDSCFWFTTLVSKKENLESVYYLLKKHNAVEVKTIPMSQGQKNSRIVAWTFLNTSQQNEWRTNRWKS
ncbi:MAG: 23S rRNA (adenine(1618)-N(6))-methyltransferase RlmF [Bacteroidetes bacterium]|nr:23S rRNA (adenine(1618)-N(6))-methyltransferase RlmF [Bacteroidota bacterium]